MNKMQVRAMMKKPWWSYALLMAGVFLFTEGCSLLYGSDELSIPISVILFSMIMHGTSLKDLSNRILLKGNKDNTKKNDEKLKDKANLTANIIAQILLVLIAVLCYYVEFKITNIFLFDIFVIIIYGIISVISYKFYEKSV